MSRACDSLYASLIQDCNELDRWTFARCALDPEALRTERRTRSNEFVEGARQVRLHCLDDPTMLAKIDLLIASENLITAYLLGADTHDTLQKISRDLIDRLLFFAGYRIYRYLTWYRRSFVASAEGRAGRSVSAVIRVRNQLRHPAVSLELVLAYFDEVVVVDQDSSDGTYDYVSALNSAKLSLHSYRERTASAGELYGHELSCGKGSLAEYYNFSFDKATGAYVCKWDADMYPLPALKEVIEFVRREQPDVLCFDGLDSYGYLSTSCEPRIYRRDLGLSFRDAEHYEVLALRPDLNIVSVADPAYLHVKLNG